MGQYALTYPFHDGTFTVTQCGRICFKARKLDEGALVPNARLAGATPLWDWIDEGATVFSY